MQKRSNAQNALLWALLTEISERLRVDGRGFEPPVWSEYFKRRFLGAEEFRLPSGEVLIVPHSSADLDEAAFSDYLSKIEVWASDRNVFLPDREAMI
jgi:hypothetical protein